MNNMKEDDFNGNYLYNYIEMLEIVMALVILWYGCCYISNVFLYFINTIVSP